jgi:nucleoid DNA-binding protein
MATILHKIKCFLYDNILTDNPNDFIARVNSERSFDVKDVCTSAVTRGGADISAAAMEHAVNLFLKEMAYNLCDGFSINTGWFTASAHIKGVFDSPNETFNRDKHTLSFDFQQGSQLRREIDNVAVEILGVADHALSIAKVTDVKTGSVNDLLTAGRNLKISGHKLKIAGDNAANGVYLVNQTTGERVKTDASDIVTNNPSELIILVPALPAGTYKVEVTTQYGNNIKTLLKEPRTTVLDKVLTVQ